MQLKLALSPHLTSLSKFRLLQGLELGNKKFVAELISSHYLHRLCNLTAGQCTDTVLRTLFLERLSNSVKSILVASDADTADPMQIDKIIDTLLKLLYKPIL